MKWVILFLFITLSHNSFSQLRKNSYKWEKIDNPDDFLIGYETRFKDLPLKGKLKKNPWSGYYWATFNGVLHSGGMAQIKAKVNKSHTLCSPKKKFSNDQKSQML